MVRDSRDIAGDFVFTSKYARTVNGQKESWNEAVSRVMNMHIGVFGTKERDPKFYNILNGIWEQYNDKKILGAQRALQFGGEQMLKNNTKMYNCCSSYVDRPDFFGELMYVLLSGAGAGYSVQNRHIKKLPIVKGWDDTSVVNYDIPDSIEGWADSVKMLMNAFYNGTSKVYFNFDNIRPKGSFVSGGFMAPGPEPLKTALMKIKSILKTGTKRKLQSFELHRVACLIADAVISGGIRRSALLCIFDAHDTEMMTCKTGKWYIDYPELGRSNNSAAFVGTTDRSLYDNVFDSVKNFGEPGFVFLSHPDQVMNPCVEVSMLPFDFETGESGWSFCNLTNVNASTVENKDDFYERCKYASYLGTIQAAYTKFDYLGDVTKRIVERDALIGVGLMGMCGTAKISFDPEVQKEAARIVKEANMEMAEILGISFAARTCVVKPDGNSSQVAGCSSGIHPYRANKYIRHIQVNKMEQSLEAFYNTNPNNVEQMWSSQLDCVVSFPVVVPEGAIVQDDLSAVEFLKLVKLTQSNWIKYGTNTLHKSSILYPQINMNVSNTVTVKDHEWNDVKEFIWSNKKFLCGVSLLGASGDLAYKQAPYTVVMDENELSKEFGVGSILASGLVVDALGLFPNLWEAIDAGMGRDTSRLVFDNTSIHRFIDRNIDENGMILYDIDGVKVSDINAIIATLKDYTNKRVYWSERFKQFADKYMDGDLDKTEQCLKRVYIFHKWNNIQDIKPIKWDSIKWKEVLKDAGEETSSGCAGGACEINKI